MIVDHIYKNPDLRAYACLHENGDIYFGTKGGCVEWICNAKHITKNWEYRNWPEYAKICDWIQSLLGQKVKVK